MGSGILYGIGVGPGAPDLLTLAAVKALAAVDVVFAPASTKNDFSLALDIIRPHLRAGVGLERLDFPMTRDDAVRRSARLQNAHTVLDCLASGNNAAFITLGDPLIYSTFGHLLRGMRMLDQQVDVRIIPGITSFQAASARLGEVLLEGDECLVVATGNTQQDKLERLLELADAAVILKPAKRLPSLRRSLAKVGRDQNTRLIVRCGLPDEQVVADMRQATETPSYFSLLHVGRRELRDGSEPSDAPKKKGNQ
jgi:precorrin-2/cobalt-factor-2 C20-methyltransferase